MHTRVGQWPGPAIVAGGLATGLLWGVNARLWMRFISADPEFSWSGTVFIVGAFGIAGLAQSVGYVGGRAAIPRAVDAAVRVIAVLGLAPLFSGAGVVMLPTVLGGGAALGNRAGRPALRSAFAVLGLVPVVIVASGIVGDFGWGPHGLVGVLWFLVIYGGIVVAVSPTFAPHRPLWHVPRAVKIASVVVLVVLVGLGPRGIG